MNIDEKPWKSMKSDKTRMEIFENEWKSMNINENRSKTKEKQYWEGFAAVAVASKFQAVALSDVEIRHLCPLPLVVYLWMLVGVSEKDGGIRYV